MQKDPPLKTRGRHWRSDVTFLAWIVGNCIGLNLLIHFCAVWIRDSGRLPEFNFDSNLHSLHLFLRGALQHDSWGPMLSAVHFWTLHPDGNIFQNIFFAEHIKFQYPLASLLPFIALNKLGFSDLQIMRYANAAGWISVLLVGAVCILIAARSAALPGGKSANLTVSRNSGILVGTLMFYPLMRGCALGQVQTILTLIYTVAFYCWLVGAERWSGALIGLLVLVKPQFALLLLWATFRKRWGALIAGLAAIGLILLIALAVFGWQNNWGYLDVLRALSRTGETYSPNQSMNGLLNRLLFNGDSQRFYFASFPAFNPIVYVGTLISSTLLVVLAMVFPGGRARRGGLADFACISAVATIASPIAWEHHYGVFLPILVWLWFGRASGNAPVRGVAWLVAAWILIGDSLSPLNALAYVPVANLALSYMYFGGLIVLWILLCPRYGGTAEGAPPGAGVA